MFDDDDGDDDDDNCPEWGSIFRRYFEYWISDGTVRMYIHTIKSKVGG